MCRDSYVQAELFSDPSEFIRAEACENIQGRRTELEDPDSIMRNRSRKGSSSREIGKMYESLQLSARSRGGHDCMRP